MAVIQVQHTIYAVIALLGVSLIRFVTKLVQQRGKLIGKPMPPHHFLFGHIPLFGKLMKDVPPDVHPHAFPYILQQKYNLPGIFYLDNWPLRNAQLIVLDPVVAQQVTVAHSLPKDPFLREFLLPLAGERNLITLEGSRWKRWRSIFNPGFSQANLLRLVPGIVKDTETFCAVLKKHAEKKRVFRLEDACTRYTVDIIGRVILDVEFGSQTGENEFVNAFRRQVNWLLGTREMNPLKIYNPIRPLVFWWNMRIMKKYITKVLMERFANTVDGNERLGGKMGAGGEKYVIDLALKAYIEESNAEAESEAMKTGKDKKKTIVGIDDEFKEYAIETVCSLLFAGHDTTSSTICYIYHVLSRHPTVLSRVVEEHNTIFPPSTSEPTVPLHIHTGNLLAKDPTLLKKLPYSTAVIKEILRIWTPASSLRVGEPGFFVTDPVTGESLPTEGFSVWITSIGLHRSERIWDNPMEFRPERFLATNEGGTGEALSAGNAYRPFEKGPRNCIGQELAMLETLVAMAMTLRSFDVKAVYEDEKWREKLVEFGEDEEGKGAKRVKRNVGRKNVKDRTMYGEHAYQVLMATAKPKEGMPAVVKVREGVMV